MAVPTGSILSLPFRRTHDASLATPIKQYISSKYDQRPDMFTSDLLEIDELRKNAVTVQEPHPSGIKRIQMYAAQLVFMGAKFPIDIGVDFIWYPSLRKEFEETPLSQNNIRFELANVLFNLGALYCQLAISTNKSTSDGLRTASNYFCLAAGVMSHLKNAVVPDMRSTPPDDMEPVTLECLEQLMLAQAQECLWQRAVKDGFKDSSISKLAAEVSDLYLKAFEHAKLSTVVSNKWIHHMRAKQSHFAGAAQYRAACDCLEKRKYGEEVARLRASLECANNALVEKRYVNEIVQRDVEGLKAKVQSVLERAQKDNDTIYLQIEPDKSELKTLDRASMVAVKITKEVSEPLSMLGDRAELGKPLFAKLVPYAVHMAASIYVSQRDATINSIVAELEQLNKRIHDLMQSLNLPGSLQALEKPLGLPPGLSSHAEEIRQQNGPDRLRRSAADVDKLKAADRAAYDEGVNFLRSEAGDDSAAQRKYGTDRWTRPGSQEAAPQLYAQVNDISGYLNASEDSDAKVRIKSADNEELITLLSGGSRGLEDYVPSSRRATITPAIQSEVTKLRNALNDATRLESKRKRKIEYLRGKAQADDVSPELLREAARLEREYPMQAVSAVQFEDFFTQRLTRYDTDRETISTERSEQETLLSRIAAANTSFTTARHGDTSTRDRERALQRLENAYFAYKEIVQNLDVGRKFYNDLATLVAKFRDDCRAFAYSRRAEAVQLEADITNSLALPMAGMNLGQGQGQQQTQPVVQANQPRTRQPHPQPRASAVAPVQQAVASTPAPQSQAQPQSHHRQPSTPLPAPKALKPPSAAPVANMTPSDLPPSQPLNSTWDPDMGIKFAGITTPQSQQQRKDTRWDPSQGVRFGGAG